MSSNKKPINLIFLITISVGLSAGATTVAAQAGMLNFFGIGPINNVEPIINGTILNNDNKTYGILIVPNNGSVVIPPTCGPNEHLHDGKCMPNPPPPVNQPPVLEVDSPIKCIVGTDCTLVVEELGDSDGNVTGVFFNQTSGPKVTLFNVNDRSASFSVKESGIYLFLVQAVDNDNAKTSKLITVNVPVVPPVPTPTGAFTFIVVGDVEQSTDGTNVYKQIKAQKANLTFVLGDLGYASSLSWFKSTYGSIGDSLYCVVGNHEANNEDGSSSLESETLKYCGNSYWIREGSTMFMVFNTNGDMTLQANNAGKLLQNATFMSGVKNLHVLSHKPCFTPPNSHHTLEIKSFCDALKSKIPSGLKVDYIQAHNHVYSQTTDKVYTQVGTGGKSHYTCPTSAWSGYCDNSHYGFAKYTVKADGTTTSQFLDYNGKVIH